jgi:hypothetical protein
LRARESNRPLPNRTGTFSCIRLSRHRIYLVSRSDPVSQVRQPEAVVFSSVDLTVALPADGHLLPVLELTLPQCFKPEQGRTTHTSNPFLVEAMCPAPLRLTPTTGTLSPWALLPVGDPVVVCQVRSTFRVSVHPLPLLIAGCVLPEDHGGDAHTPVRQESGFQRLSRR